MHLPSWHEKYVRRNAGARLRKMISAITDNRLLACGTGTAITALIQSSSVTTVMLVGLVNAGRKYGKTDFSKRTDA